MCSGTALLAQLGASQEQLGLFSLQMSPDAWRGRGCFLLFGVFFWFMCLFCFFMSNTWIYYHCNNSLNPEVCFFNIILYCNIRNCHHLTIFYQQNGSFIWVSHPTPLPRFNHCEQFGVSFTDLFLFVKYTYIFLIFFFFLSPHMGL